jgi:hypothetical protein
MGSMSDEMLMFNTQLAERVSITVDETMAFMRQAQDMMTPINLDPTVASTKMIADTTLAETLRKAKKDRDEFEIKKVEIESRVAENMAQAEAAMAHGQRLLEYAVEPRGHRMSNRREPHSPR